MASKTLTVADLVGPLAPTFSTLGVTAFAHRDQELSQRDITVASYVALMNLQVATVFGFQIDPLILPSVPPNVLQYHLSDTGGSAPTTPADVNHVQNSGTPSDAITTDQTLYGRDAIVYEALARMAFVFAPEDRLLHPLDFNMEVDNTWSKGKASPDYADVSASSWYARDTWFKPDRYLAGRDNTVAYHAAILNTTLLNVFETANRLLIRVSATPTTYLPPVPNAPVVS